MRPIRLAVGLLVVFSASPLALADGGFFYPVGVAAQIAQTRQEVVIAFHKDAAGTADQATYVLRSRYTGEPGELAWVVPVPTTPTNVLAHEDGLLFDRLDAAAAPYFVLNGGYHGGGITCACAMPLLDTGGLQGGLVTVEASGQAGIYDWDAVTSTGGTTLLAWLNDNGFALPAEAAAILDGYIQQEMHFLAIRVRELSGVQAGVGGGIETPPIQFTCDTSMRFYPMAISRISAASETEVLIYIWADHRAEAANAGNGVIDRSAVVYDASSPSMTNYESLFTAKVAELDGKGLITEYAGSYSILQFYFDSPWPDAPAGVDQLEYLTRLRTVIAKDAMTFDYTFQDAASDNSVSNLFTVSATSQAASLGGYSLIAVVLFAGLRAMVRRGPSVQRST